jgi:RNA polymerase sigma-70 factor (ECF subfamily)
MQSVPGEAVLTLGEVLYAGAGISHVSEKQWLALVKAIGAGDEAALRSLYDKTSPLLLAYLLRLTGDRLLAEELLVQVFQSVWCDAPVFDRTQGPVIGWIMRLARARALDGARESARQAPGGASQPSAVEQNAEAPATVTLSTKEDSGLMLLDALSAQEREAIQAVFVDGLSYADAAAPRALPDGAFKTWIRSGLWKLQRVLQARGQES